MISPMKGLAHRKAMLVLCLVVIAAALGVGFRLDWKGFAGNALAELAGMIASILIAIALVARFTKAERDARWSAVADATTRTLEAAAVRASLPAFVQLPTPRSPALDPQMARSVGRLPQSLAALADALRDLSQDPFAAPSDARQFLDAVLPSTRVITDVVLPRLLSLDVDPRLIEPIVELESIVAQLDYHAWMAATMQISPSTLLKDAADLVAALSTVVHAHTQQRRRGVSNAGPAPNP
jgi:hypothetical protein